MPPARLSLFDYLKAQEALIEHEKRLADIAQQVAAGKLAVSELDQENLMVQAHRELVKVVLERVLADMRQP